MTVLAKKESEKDKKRETDEKIVKIPPKKKVSKYGK